MLKNKKNRELLKRIVAMLCAALVALAFIVSIVVNAAPTKKELEDASKKTKEAHQNLQNAEKQRNDAVNEYKAIDKQISDTEDEIGIIEVQIEQTKKDLEIKKQELLVAEEEYNKYEEVFKQRARTMYENGDVAYLEILFGAKSFSDFISKIEVISQIVEYDNTILDKLKEAKQKVEDAKNEVEAILASQETNKANLDSRRTSLEANLAKKQSLIDSLTSDVQKYKAIYESAEKAEAELIRENQKALSYAAYPVTYTGGKLAWPVPSSGRITSQYGYRIHPVYKTKKFHSGIDIGVGYGQDIVAAADGVVTMAATNGGYGKCLIINHGSGLTTLYGHNSSLLVSNGQSVTRGQVIAKAGSTGVSTGPHCHFEVRVNGATRDPLQYLK